MIAKRGKEHFPLSRTLADQGHCSDMSTAVLSTLPLLTLICASSLYKKKAHQKTTTTTKPPQKHGSGNSTG